MSSKVSTEELEELMKEYATDPNYRDIPMLQPPYLKSQLWKHQYQMIHAMCSAEFSPPATNAKGELFYSRAGLLPSPTGTGKTATVLGVACYDVPDPLISDVILTTALNTIMIKPKSLPMIQCTVICTDAKILDNAWQRDINTFYDQRLTYYRFETIGEFEKQAKNDQEYQHKMMELNQLSSYMRYYLERLDKKEINQVQFEVALLMYGDIKDRSDVNKYIADKTKELEDLFDKITVRLLYQVMSTHRIFFVTRTSFYYLFKLFDYYRVARFVFDEPQGVTLTNQDRFEELFKDPRVSKMRSLGSRLKAYAEQSPFGFMWYVSATPHLIGDNVDKHYFNAWVYKNDFLINDYSTHVEDKRMFPEMTKQYVIKFPYSYCLESRPDFLSLIKNYTLKAKRNAVAAILTGVLGDDFDQMLENDDFEGVVAKLGNNGSVNTVLQDAQRRLEMDIYKHEQRIRLYDANTPKHVVDKSTDELNKEKKNLVDLMKKIARFHGQNIQGAPPDDCLFCYESLQIVPTNGMDPRKICVAHMGCMSIFHAGCIGDYMKADKNATCPNCRGELCQENLKPTYDMSGHNLAQQTQIENSKPQVQNFTIDTEKEYDSKMDALKAALGPMERWNGQAMGWYRRQRVLLFLELRGEDSGKLDQIIYSCQDLGYNIMLPFKVGTIAAMSSRFPSRNGTTVSQKGTDINKDQEKFMNNTGAVVWIFRSIKDAAGLNFPAADTLIMYSDFKHKTQIFGRIARLNRVVPCDVFTIRNV